jgi:biopolymer transport protein ExbD
MVQGRTTSGILGHGRQMRRYRLPLTPMADVMFQLLLFFMVSSISAPYSLLNLQSAPPAATTATGEEPAEAAEAVAEAVISPDTAIWSLTDGQMIVGGQPFPLDQLPALVSALVQAGTASIVLISRADASVQDLTTVLEALQTGGIVSVQLAAEDLG